MAYVGDSAWVPRPSLDSIRASRVARSACWRGLERHFERKVGALTAGSVACDKEGTELSALVTGSGGTYVVVTLRAYTHLWRR
jgi:hypothetical protein